MKSGTFQRVFLVTITLIAGGCGYSSPLTRDPINATLNFLTMGVWGKTGLQAMVDLPDKNWPMTSDEVKQGVGSLRKGFLGVDGAIKHLEQAVADNPCDASAHAYLAIAFAYREAKVRGGWESAMQQQSDRMRGYPSTGIGAAFPNATARYYDQLYESQVGSKLQPMRQSQSALMARAVALKRGGVSGCAR